MAEEIKVVLEADARQLTSEFKKAQQSAEQFSKKTLPLTTAEMNRLFVQQQRVGKELVQGQRAVKNYGHGMLQMAQFADDAQYGLRGVMNNIPGLVMGFGGGAGLAGALSIAALAGSKLLPVLKQIFAPGEDAAKLKEVADQILELRKRSEELASVRGAASAKAFIDQLDDEERGIKRQNEALARTIDLLRLRAIAAGNVADAQDQFDMARISSDQLMSPDEKNRQTLEVQQRQVRRKSQERLDALNQRVSQATFAAQEKRDAVTRQQQDVAALRERLVSDEAEKKKLAGKIAAADRATALRDRLVRLNETGRDPESNELLLGRKFYERRKTLEDALSEAERVSPGNVTGADRRRLGDLRGAIPAQQKALDQMITKENDLADVSWRAGEARDFARKSAEAEAAAVIETYKIERDSLKLGEQAAAAKSAARDAAVRNLRTFQDRVSAGIKERGAMYSTIPSAGRTGALRIGGLDTTGLRPSRGLRTSAEEAERRARATTGSSLEAKAASYYDRSLSNEERMIKAFESLGIL